MLKIDVFTHIWPPEFHRALKDLIGEMGDITRRCESVPMMVDLDRRFEVMDMFGPEYRQILSLGSPPLEKVAAPEDALRLSRIGSDAMARLCAEHPDRFPGFIGTAPLSHPGAAGEARRAIEELGACGMQVYTNVGGKPLDLPEFDAFFAVMHETGKPVWLHPARGADFPDYQSETRSEYEIWWTFGWPYESSAAMARMVFSGLFDRYPDLQVITHHAGAMIPFFEGRVGPGWDQMGARTSGRDLQTEVLGRLKRPHMDYFRAFHADTATFGSRRAIEHALDFFGEDRVLFATDAPFDPEGGPMYIRETMAQIDAIDLAPEVRRKIYEGNAARLLGLDLEAPA